MMRGIVRALVVAWVWGATCVLGLACGNDAPKHAQLIEPVYGDPCRYNDCSEHGQCVAGEQGGPLCLCEVGYAHSACQACEPGFHWDFEHRCAPDRSCAELQENPCGTAGSCDDRDGVIACHCDPGYQGPRCTLCQTGYGRDSFGDCLQMVLGSGGCAEDSCGGHGACDDASGTVRCTCDAGYGGAHCLGCAPGFGREKDERCVPLTDCQPSACGDNGRCDDSSGAVVCTCAAGYAGAACERCAAGFHEQGGICLLDQNCLDNTCAGHGACTLEGSSLTCACEPAYTGPRCDACAEGHHRGVDDLCVANETCASDLCGAHGTCDDSHGIVLCKCDDGYAGEACDVCAPGFHTSAMGCVLDIRCQSTTCPVTATCEDTTGLAICTCKEGYAGAQCELCALGYRRDVAHGTCVEADCHESPGLPAGRVDFDELPGFPTFENNCVASVAVDSKDVSFTSIGGDGTVWACATNTLYAVTSDHVFVEAGQEGPAEIIFRAPIGKLSFRYGARSALVLEIAADGVVIDALNAGRRTNGVLSYTFDAPITLFSLRSANGTTNQLALDEVAYAPALCE